HRRVRVSQEAERGGEVGGGRAGRRRRVQQYADGAVAGAAVGEPAGDGDIVQAVVVEVAHRPRQRGAAGRSAQGGGNFLRGGKGGGDRAGRRHVDQHPDGRRFAVHDGDIGLAVAIEVADGHLNAGKQDAGAQGDDGRRPEQGYGGRQTAVFQQFQ